MVYGGPHVQTVDRVLGIDGRPDAQYPRRARVRGLEVRQPRLGRRGHAFEAALNRNMGTVEVRDQVDGVRFVAASWPEVDASRVGVTGGATAAT